MKIETMKDIVRKRDAIEAFIDQAENVSIELREVKEYAKQQEAWCSIQIVSAICGIKERTLVNPYPSCLNFSDEEYSNQFNNACIDALIELADRFARKASRDLEELESKDWGD